MKYNGKMATFIFAIIFCSLAALFLLDFRVNAQQIRSEEANGKSEEKWNVDIVGFNYTDRYIDSFAVNGSGGWKCLSEFTNQWRREVSLLRNGFLCDVHRLSHTGTMAGRRMYLSYTLTDIERSI